VQQDLIAEGLHIVNGLYPVADAFASSMTTDYVSLKNFRRVTWIIHTGVATSGTADGVITVLAASDAAGTGAGAIAFKYRVCASSTTVDTWGALTDVASTGVAMAAASNRIYVVTVTAESLSALDADNSFIALKVTEDTNDPVVASVLTLLDGARYPQDVPVSAIA